MPRSPPERSHEPQGSRRANNKLRTRTAILDAALACITGSGLQATTMDQIAATAEVARATLFNYFPSKSAIVDALVADSDANFLTAVERWRERPALNTGARLLGLFAETARFLEHASAKRRALVALSWLHWADRQSLARIHETRAAFAGLLEDGRQAGDVPTSLDVERAADVICNAYMGLVHSWWMEEQEPIGDRFAGAARLLARMIDPGIILPGETPAFQSHPAVK